MKPTKEDIAKTHRAFQDLADVMVKHNIKIEVSEPVLITGNPVIEIYVDNELSYETSLLVLSGDDLCDAMELLYEDVSNQLQSHQ